MLGGSDDRDRDWMRVRRWLRLGTMGAPEAWIAALFLTTIEMLRDLRMQTIGRSWLELPVRERRTVYADVVRRVVRNMSWTSLLESGAVEGIV
jgi:hypothetical protein